MAGPVGEGIGHAILDAGGKFRNRTEPVGSWVSLVLLLIAQHFNNRIGLFNLHSIIEQ